MKWSKEKDKEVDKIVNYLVELVEAKCQSKELPKWVIDQVEKRLRKIKEYQSEARKCGFQGVALLILSLLATPLSMVFGEDVSFVFLGVFASIAGVAGADNLLVDRKRWKRAEAEGKEAFIEDLLFGREPSKNDMEFRGYKKIPEGTFSTEDMPEDVYNALETYMDDQLAELF